MANIKDLFSRTSKTSGDGPASPLEPKKGLPSAFESILKKIDLNFFKHLDLKELISGKKQVVGLDIGSSSLKLMEIIESGGGFLMNRFIQLPLERGVIVDGAIVELGKLVDALKALFKNSGCQRKGIVTSLSGHSVIVKKATFPNMEDQELRDMIHDEAGKYLPFDSMDDVNFDFQILGQNEYNPNHLDVIIVAAKKENIETYVEAIEMAGLSAVILDVDSFALETMYEKNYDYDEKDIAVIVNIGASITNINVVKNATSIFTRDFTVGSNSITEAIQAQYGGSFDDAERLKIEGPQEDSLARRDFQSALLSFADPILSEIERSVDYFRSTYGDEDIRQVLIAGGGAFIPGIAQDLSQRLNISAEIIQPFRKIGVNKKIMSQEDVERIGPVAAVAVGLALRRIGDK
ncbi:MAG: Cell division protein FtsA [Syntrophus sp. SKADARSKE-3]|nr:Cell division protein FtsA [Syntrophus sp. SKADARSKE-3]